MVPSDNRLHGDGKGRARRDQGAQALEQHLGAPAVICPRSQMSVLRQIAGDEAELIEADLRDEGFSFYWEPPATTPAQPWLTSPSHLPPLSIHAGSVQDSIWKRLSSSW